MSNSGATIPLNDLKRLIGLEVPSPTEAAIRSLTSGWWLNGQENKSFCSSFANYVGVNECLGVANGTDALELALRAILDCGTGDGTEVVTVANAGGYTSIACSLVGLTPVYADIEEKTQLLDISSAISSLRRETAVVVATHLYGGVVNVPKLRAALDQAGYSHLPILEDCAQAHGARLGDRMVGSMGNIATFSFYPTKNLGASGDGGAIVSSDAVLMERCRALHQYGWRTKYEIGIPNGRNSRLDEIQAAILSTRLPQLDTQNARRVAILDAYCAAAPDSIEIVRAASTVAHLAVVMTDNRSGLAEHLRKSGIDTDIHYPLLDIDQVGLASLGAREAPNGLPISRSSASKILTVPCFPQMTPREIERVCEALAAWKS